MFRVRKIFRTFNITTCKVLTMSRLIYVDNAATTRLDPAAFEAMKPFLVDEYGNASQPYAFARMPKKALRDARETIASCIGASPEEIFFTSGGTESDNWAIKGSALLNARKNATVTSAFEHHAVLHPCKTLEQLGYPVAYMWPSREGYITAEILKKYITSQTYLTSVMFANNEIGTVQPIKELCAVAHENGSLFHTDAVQAVGHISINVHDLGVDMLSASAHKFNGPKGVGFLYIRNGIEILPYSDGGAQEFGLRAGTENIAGIVGMAVALKNNRDALEENVKHVRELESMLVDMLDSTSIQYTRNGGADILPGLVSLSFPGADGEAVLHRLDLRGICVSTGSACNSKSTDVSHVLQAIRLEDSYAKGTIRISLGKANTEDDVEAIFKALVKIFHI